MIRSRLKTLILGAALATAMLSVPARAQSPTPSVPGPYNIDVGAVITNTLRTTGIFSANGPINLAYNGLICTMDITGYSGSPSTSFEIDQYDAATQSWLKIGASNAVQLAPVANAGNNQITVGTPVPVEIAAGIAITGLPANMTAANLRIPRVWRITQYIQGTLGPAITGAIGCNFLK